MGVIVKADGTVLDIRPRPEETNTLRRIVRAAVEDGIPLEELQETLAGVYLPSAIALVYQETLNINGTEEAPSE